MPKSKSPVEIRISTLLEGLSEFHFKCQPSDFEGRQLAESGFFTKSTDSIDVDVFVQKRSDEIAVTLKTSATALLTCDRCLTPIARVLTNALDIIYTCTPPLDGECDREEEYRHIAKHTEYIDLTEDVGDVLMLSLPMKVTCVDNPECKMYSSTEDEGNREEGKHTAEARCAWQESLAALKKDIVN